MPGIDVLPAARLRAMLESEILSGRMARGDRLPSERALSDQHGVHRITVQKALGQLEAEGLIYRQDRSGWFVAPARLHYDPAVDVSFTDNARRQGREPGSVLLLAGDRPADAEAAEALGLPRGAKVTHIRRVRTLEGRPVFVEDSHVVAARCPGLVGLAGSHVSLAALYRGRYGIDLRRRWVRMRPAALGEADAEHLRAAPGAPGLFLSRLSCDQANWPLSYDREYWRHDALEIIVQVGTVGLDRA